MSKVKVDTIEDTSGNERFTATAWVSYDADPAAIKDSGNVSSLTDNGVGNFTLNFGTAMSNANYCIQGTCSPSDTSVAAKTVYGVSHGTGGVQIYTAYANASNQALADYDSCVAIFGGR